MPLSIRKKAANLKRKKIMKVVCFCGIRNWYPYYWIVGNSYPLKLNKSKRKNRLFSRNRRNSGCSKPDWYQCERTASQEARTNRLKLSGSIDLVNSFPREAALLFCFGIAIRGSVTCKKIWNFRTSSLVSLCLISPSLTASSSLNSIPSSLFCLLIIPCFWGLT